MSYLNNFQHADHIAAHLQTVVPTLADHLLKAKYAGFMAVAAVTVYEMAIKQIFCDFANQKHKVLGSFTESFFYRINGRIKLQVIKDEYVKFFGHKYKDRFKKNLDLESSLYLRATGRDIVSSYSNLIVWRNDFSHQAATQSLSTFDETVKSYQDGKQVIASLAKSMTR